MHKGKVVTENMEKESITPQELEMELREYGLQRPEAAELAVMERDGTLTVVPYDEHHSRDDH